MSKNGYAFISYSTKDGLFVANLTDILKSCQISYWKAPEMIPAGSNYAKEIPKAIRGCEVFILVLSESAQESIWIEKEVDVAVCCKKRIIPIKIDHIPLNDMYRFYLNNVQFVDACISEKMPWDRVEEKLTRVFEEYLEIKTQEALEQFKNTTDGVRFDEKEGFRNVDTRSNALRINKIPLQCEYCGGNLEQRRLGVYTCMKCSQENYDDFRKVRNFLEKVGTAPVAVIARNTGVSVKTIDYLVKNDYVGSDS